MNILFLCTANVSRSYLAEAFLDNELQSLAKFLIALPQDRKPGHSAP